MDESWDRAVVTALDGNLDTESTRTLTLDGAVKCFHGRLPPPSFLERFVNLQHLSIANIGLTSLEQFPQLRNLQKLILSDNRIAGGLEFLVEAGLESLRDLDLSNNRIQYIEDLAPLAQVRLVSLDLYECPVTRIKDYRSRVFGLIKSLKYLDKMDAEENERPESDDEEDEDEDVEDEDVEEEDPGSGEIDGEDRPYNNGHSVGCEGIVDVDEDEESDADEEETESSRRANGLNHQLNGFHVAQAVNVEDDDEEEDDEEDGDYSGEEIDEEDGDEDVVEVHEIEDSDDNDDVVEDDDDEDDDDDDEDDINEVEEDEEEEVDNEEGDLAYPESNGRLTSTEGEIDGHEQGEEDGEEDDDNGETGEEEQGNEDDCEFEDDEVEEEEDYGAGYLVRPVGQAGGSGDMNPRYEEDSEEEEVEDVQELPPSSSHLKRNRDVDVDDDNNDEDDDDDDGDGSGDEDDIVEYRMAPKKQR